MTTKEFSLMDFFYHVIMATESSGVQYPLISSCLFSRQYQSTLCHETYHMWCCVKSNDKYHVVDYLMNVYSIFLRQKKRQIQTKYGKKSYVLVI